MILGLLGGPAKSELQYDYALGLRVVRTNLKRVLDALPPPSSQVRPEFMHHANHLRGPRRLGVIVPNDRQPRETDPLKAGIEAAADEILAAIAIRNITTALPLNAVHLSATIDLGERRLIINRHWSDSPDYPNGRATETLRARASHRIATIDQLLGGDVARLPKQRIGALVDRVGAVSPHAKPSHVSTPAGHTTMEVRAGKSPVEEAQERHGKAVVHWFFHTVCLFTGIFTGNIPLAAHCGVSAILDTREVIRSSDDLHSAQDGPPISSLEFTVDAEDELVDVRVVAGLEPSIEVTSDTGGATGESTDAFRDPLDKLLTDAPV